ncbi:MAG: methyl-accepting chemotaxis protein [halophilic archaeon J07HB67]|jgi:Methyl-accepting chemotaxis protein|nr:MAG: methyl-accepting chemotaxis protein [halophilic archaeon J07HB67]
MVELIADIAEQTNMLALNANIEAARADIDGDGFAVVADEVKQLATQAQTHADEIDEIVAGIDADTEATAHRLRDAETAVRDSADTVTEAREALETVVERTEATERGMSEIDRATDDQAASAEQVSSMVAAVAELAGDTDELTRDAGEAAREQNDAITGVTETAESLSERATRLDELLATFDHSESHEAVAETPAGRRDPATDD